MDIRVCCISNILTRSCFTAGVWYTPEGEHKYATGHDLHIRDDNGKLLRLSKDLFAPRVGPRESMPFVMATCRRELLSGGWYYKIVHQSHKRVTVVDESGKTNTYSKSKFCIGPNSATGYHHDQVFLARLEKLDKRRHAEALAQML